MAGMTSHRQEAISALDLAAAHREVVAQEYAKPANLRDYNRISDQRHAAKVAVLEAQVHATLAPAVVVVVDNRHDAHQAVRGL